MNSRKTTCARCGAPLAVKRTWRRVYLHCRECSADYPMEAYAQRIDDDLEEQLAHIPCDRI